MAVISQLRAKFTATTQGFMNQVQQVQQQLNQIGPQGQQGADQADSGFQRLRNTILGFAGAYVGFSAIAGAVGGLINVTDEYQKALNGLQQQTGATDEEMKGMETSLKNIYAGGYGENFKDIADSMALVENATGLAGAELEEASKKALLLRDSMGLEVSETTRTASTMMKQFGISADEAFELFAQGQQSGLNKHDDMLDSFNEYSVYFKQLGFDAEGMWNTFKAGSESGSFNIDKVGDTIKELGIRVKDGSKTTTDAFTALGLNADEMAQMFAKGGDSSQLALNKMFVALNQVQDPVKKTQIGVALMGTQFEDLEADTIMALGQIRNEADMTGDTMQKMDDLQFNNIGAAFEYIKRNIVVGLLDPIQQQAMPLINKFLNFMKSNLPQIQSIITGAFSGIVGFIDQIQPSFTNLFKIFMNIAQVVGPLLAGAIAGIMAVMAPLMNTITGVVAAFTSWEGFIPVVIGLATAIGTYMAITKAATVAAHAVNAALKIWVATQRILNLVLAANPIGIVVALLTGLVAALIYAWNNSETFRTIMTGAWDSIKAAAMAVVDWVTTTIPVWIENIKLWFTGLGQSISTIWTGIKDFIVGIWNSVVAVVGPIVTGFIDMLVQGWTNFKTNVMTLITPLIDFFKNTWENIKLAVLSIIGIFLNLITGNFEGLKTSLLGLWTAIKDQVLNIVTTLKDLAIAAFNLFVNGVKTIFTTLKNTAVTIWNGIKTAVVNAATALKNGAVNTFNALKNGVVNTVNGIKNGVVNGFNSAKTLAINAWNALKNGVSTAINSVKKYVTDMKTNIVNTVKGINLKKMGADIIQGLINGITSKIKAVGKAIKDVTSAITGKIQSILDIHSPSRVLIEMGQYTGEGLAIGLANMKGMVEDASGALAEASFGTLNDAELNDPMNNVAAPQELPMAAGGTNYHAPLMNIENYYQNDATDVRSISNGLYNLQRNSDRKKGK